MVLPSNTTTFTANEGLPVCAGDAFVSPEGRVFISTCGPFQSEINIYLYEFDGKQGVKVPFHKYLGNTEAIPVYWGLDQNGAFFGYFHYSGELKESVFLFHPKSGEIQVLSFKDKMQKDGQVLKVDYDPEYGYLIYAADEDNSYLFQWEGTTVKTLGILPKNKEPLNPSYGAVFRPLFLRQKETLWFWENRNPYLYEFDFVTQQLQKYRLSDIDPEESRDRKFNLIGLAKNSAGEIIISALGNSNRIFYYKLERQRNAFLPILKQQFSAEKNVRGKNLPVMFKDQVGNLMLCKKYGIEDAVWWMMENETGKVYDYTQVFKTITQNLPRPRALIASVKGGDFRKSILVTGFGGISFAEIRSIDGIQTFPTFGTREMIALDSGQVLLKSEREVRIWDLDVSNGSLNTIKSKEYACLSNQSTHNLSNFLSDTKGKIYLSSGSSSVLPRTKACSDIEVGVPFYRFTILKNDVVALAHEKTKGLYYFDLSTQQLRPAIVGDSILRFSSPVFQLKELSDGFLWVGTGSGLWRVYVKTNEAIQLNPELPFQQDQIYYIEEGEDGMLWLGTGNGGVQIYDPQKGSVKIIDESKGLSNNTVTSILKDNSGTRWVNTYNGVNLISPEGTFLTKLYAADGLANSEGNRFSSIKTRDGKILFGSIDGTTLIHPERVKQQFLGGKELQIFLNQVSYYEQKLKQDTSLYQQLDGPLALVLPPSNRYLKLGVALSDLQKVEENQFSYRFEWPGEETVSDWFFMGNQSELNLTNLPVGKYDLVIKGTNYRGQQAVNQVRISIHAKEFFYKQSWFFILVLLVLLSLPLLRLVQERIKRRRLQILVSERTKELENDKKVIEEQAEKLKELDQFKSRLFTNISHEFRTPLTVILGILDQVEKKPNSWLKRGTQIIRRSSHNLLDLVNQMLELQKLESGSLKINWQLGNIVPLIQTIFEQFQAYAQSKVQQMEFINKVEELQMDFDEEKTLRIISNLLSNAIKYTPEGGQISLGIAVEKEPTLSPDSCLLINVKDSGQGISKEELPHIFNRFYQADNHNSKMGTGIGLALTQDLVHLLGGKINVESTEGQGTHFQVFLPITQKATPKPISNPENIQSLVFGSNIAIQKKPTGASELPLALIIEDNQDIATYLQACLEGRYHTEFAYDGAAGIEVALEKIPDIIISDVMMPNKDGFQVCEFLKEDIRSSHIPIILLTAKSDVASRIAGLKRGADDYLAKPFHEEELLVRMQNLLKTRQRLQERYQDIYEAPLPKVKLATPNVEDGFILKIQALFEEHILDPDFDLKLLSKELNLSRANFFRKVKALTGRTPAIYIRSLRLQKARQLLVSSDLPVKQIAYDVGFSDPAYFTKSYMTEFGENPSETRH